MSYRPYRRSAYYGANFGNEFSRSGRAAEAESNGRYPLTRAASHLGVSAAAFRAGCAAMGYVSSEWHHVGKYATMVDYWDTERCATSPEFWRGAASVYKSKSKSKVAELVAKAAAAYEATKADRRADFINRLARQRDCSRSVPSHDTSENLRRYNRWLNDEADRMSYNKLCLSVLDAERNAEFAHDQFLTSQQHTVTAIVPTIIPGSSGNFTLADSVEVLEVCVDGFSRRMSDAKMTALRMGWDGVAIHSRSNGGKSWSGGAENGWVPCRFVARQLVEVA